MKSLLFKEHMLHQVIEGNKTHTRRVVKLPQWAATGSKLGEIELQKHGEFNWWPNIPHRKTGCLAEIQPRYKKGDICYLKEPYLLMHDKAIYKFDNPDLDKEVIKITDGKSNWSNKLFMKEIHARYFVKITNVTSEYLMEISPSDCIKEGIELLKQNTYKEQTYKVYGLEKASTTDPYFSFSTLWQSINEKAPSRWNDDPLVWVYDFELIDKIEVYK